ncbi:MAG: CARDB domain-containing protein [bacterium]
MDCGETCDADFNEGTGVSLTAIPDSGSRFVSWGDECGSCGTQTICNITMDVDKACSATFDLSPVSGPDLVVSSLTAPESARPGGLIRVMNSVTNQGTEKAGRSKVGFYLSANDDPTIGPEDLLMGSRSVPPPAGPRKLAPGKTSSTKKRLRIPSDTVAGTYYVKAKADHQDVVQETDETNNILVSGEINIQ